MTPNNESAGNNHHIPGDPDLHAMLLMPQKERSASNDALDSKKFGLTTWIVDAPNKRSVRFNGFNYKQSGLTPYCINTIKR
jgi:lysozyme family protein